MRRRADFVRVFQQGRHHSGRLLQVRSVPNQAPLTRFAFAIPKRVGVAVVRNRIRRRLREVLRASNLTEGYDLVISVRPEAARSTFDMLREELTTLLKRSHLLGDQA